VCLLFSLPTGVILNRNILKENSLSWPQQSLALFSQLPLVLPYYKWTVAVVLILSLEKAKVGIMESLKLWETNQLQMRKKERKEEKRRNSNRVKQMR
jgi:hypothetical protein